MRLHNGIAGLRIYHANLPFDFRPEVDGFGTRVGFTNDLLIPTREPPTGSSLSRMNDEVTPRESDK